jgi:ABC-2 type transport system ATP-binding protein
MSAVAAIALREVTKDFHIGLRGVRLRAVDRLTLQIEPGEIFGLLGPNGGGKSTTIKMILGFLQPTSGACEVFGVPSGQTEARRAVGYLPESPDFYRYLTGRELVTFYGELCGLDRRSTKDRVSEVIEQVRLSHAADRRVATYSKGMLQRIGLAQALVHDPKLLILDEPTAGVDPVAAAATCELMLALKREGKTILITSHLLGQIEDVCDRVAILDHGKLVMSGRVTELTGSGSESSVGVPDLSPEHHAELDEWLHARGYQSSHVGKNPSRLDRIFCDHVERREPLAS